MVNFYSVHRLSTCFSCKIFIQKTLKGPYHRIRYPSFLSINFISVSDPNQHVFTLWKTFWIRIRMEDADPNPEIDSYLKKETELEKQK